MIGLETARRLVLPALLALLMGGGAQALAAGEPASGVNAASRTRVRLVSAHIPYHGRPEIIAGIEIQLEPGWKTYWRSPGDGLAPSIEWRGSVNLKAAAVLWPAPSRFDEPGGLTSIGYKTAVLLPVLVTPADPAAPVTLVARLHIGACKDICIPVEMTLRLEIAAEDQPGAAEALRAALDRVPKEQSRGVYCPHGFVTAKRRVVNGKEALVLKTSYAEQATGLDLFAEAPDGFAQPMPVRQPDSTRGRSHYVVAFESEEARKALTGHTLLLTAVSDQGSCETSWRME